MSVNGSQRKPEFDFPTFRLDFHRLIVDDIPVPRGRSEMVWKGKKVRIKGAESGIIFEIRAINGPIELRSV